MYKVQVRGRLYIQRHVVNETYCNLALCYHPQEWVDSSRAETKIMA